MEKFTLKTMTDFLLEQSENYLKGFIALNEYHSITLNYANFLKQPLTLGMFVPIDEEGNVLEERRKDDYSFYTHINLSAQEEYQQAKEKVLFEGFKICDRGDNTCVMTNEYHLNGFMWKDKTVEMLCSYNVTLTETAIKIIYGN